MDEIDKCIDLKNFLEYVVEENNNYYKLITGFKSSQSKNDQGYEKVIQIKKNNEWSIIFYAIYNNSTKEQEMFVKLTGIEIECVKKLIKDNIKAIKDFEFYINKVEQTFDKIK